MRAFWILNLNKKDIEVEYSGDSLMRKIAGSHNTTNMGKECQSYISNRFKIYPQYMSDLVMEK